MRYAARRDSNDGAITDALRKAGFVVYDYAQVGQVPDKLVTKTLPDGTEWVCWVEVKAPKGRITESQARFRMIFEGRQEFYVARDPEDTIRELYDRYSAAIRPESLR